MEQAQLTKAMRWMFINAGMCAAWAVMLSTWLDARLRLVGTIMMATSAGLFLIVGMGLWWQRRKVGA